MKNINVDVWSDIACPWCYVGEASFKIASEQFLSKNPDYKINVIFHSYMIDPATNKNGEDYLQYNIRRWGSDSWTSDLKMRGKPFGCIFGNWKTWPNTFLSHTLMAEAKKQNKASEVLEEIFLEQYENGQNVSLESELNEIAKKFNISNWNTPENQKSVIDQDNEAKNQLNIHSVPRFKFPNGVVVEGARQPGTFLNALKENIV